jgi:drug/metabolite transporter (DMT)-like permease
MGMACVLFALGGWAARGLPLPSDASAHNWLWLGVSGVIGFTIGDLCLFRAFVLMGPRLALLLLTVWPVLAAVISWAVLGETLSATALLGMALTIGGVAWVILERTPTDAPPEAHVSAGGLLLALASAACQAVGIVMSKVGMAGYDTFASTQIRALAGFGGFVVLIFLLRGWPRVVQALRNGPGMGYTSLGAVFGPFLGVWLALVAIKNAEIGVATTILAIVPIQIIPPAILIYHERVSIRAVFGAVVAVAGVALLFL